MKVHKLLKKEQSQYPAILTEQAWSIKYLLYGFWGNFSLGTWQAVPSWQDSSILPAWVANHSAGFDSSCLLSWPYNKTAYMDRQLYNYFGLKAVFQGSSFNIKRAQSEVVFKIIYYLLVILEQGC